MKLYGLKGQRLYLTSTEREDFLEPSTRCLGPPNLLTHEIWPVLQEKFDIYISALVIQEASYGDKEAAKKRMSTPSEFPVLEITPQVQNVADSLIAENAIPVEAEEDALHIAVASLNGIEFLLTWNFKHINDSVDLI